MQGKMRRVKSAKNKDERMMITRNIRAVTEYFTRLRSERSHGISGNGFYIDLGKRIESKRLNLNMSQDDLGMLWGVTQSEVSNIERGKRKVSPEQISMLKFYDSSIDLNELLGCNLTETDELNENFRAITSRLNSEGIHTVKKILEMSIDSDLYRH